MDFLHFLQWQSQKQIVEALLLALSIPQIFDHFPLLFPSLCIEFHHPGFVFGMVFSSGEKRFVTSISVVHMQQSLT